jgi:adenosylcobinamide kinase/adenosylcobinamide-phosphate guanylyltransferase
LNHWQVCREGEAERGSRSQKTFKRSPLSMNEGGDFYFMEERLVKKGMTTKMVLVVGGARSGKSTFAQEMATGLGLKVTYLATAEAGDGEMSRRIERHQAARPAEWETVELWGASGLREIPVSMEAALLDCFTILLSNLMAKAGLDWPVEEEMDMPEEEVLRRMERVEEEALGLVDKARDASRILIIVSNEVGMGLVPPYRLGRIFRDLAGRLNQRIAARADEAWTVISGIPLCLKKQERMDD